MYCKIARRRASDRAITPIKGGPLGSAVNGDTISHVVVELAYNLGKYDLANMIKCLLVPQAPRDQFKNSDLKISQEEEWRLLVITVIREGYAIEKGVLFFA